MANTQSLSRIPTRTTPPEPDASTKINQTWTRRIEGEKEYEVEKIISSEIRITRWRVKGKNTVIKKLFYLVKWKGYPEDECTREPGEQLTHADDEIETFHRQNPNAPTIELS